MATSRNPRLRPALLLALLALALPDLTLGDAPFVDQDPGAALDVPGRALAGASTAEAYGRRRAHLLELAVKNGLDKHGNPLPEGTCLPLPDFSPHAPSKGPGSAKKVMWFIALAPPKDATDVHAVEFAQAAKVSVLSAAKNAPSLEPHLIYLGEKDELSEWMGEHGVEVHFRTLSFWDDLNNKQKNGRHHDNFINYGAYGRLEIPLLIRELQDDRRISANVDPEAVLYTDADVLFVKDIEPGTLATPPIFAAAYEGFHPGINSGVLWMNVTRMQEEHPKLMAYGNEKHWNFPLLDQTMLEDFYKGRVEILPDTYNTRAFFRLCAADMKTASDAAKAKGVPLETLCDKAVLWHFHGYKPWDVACWFDQMDKGAPLSVWQDPSKEGCRWHKFIHPDACYLQTYAQLLATWEAFLGEHA